MRRLQKLTSLALTAGLLLALLVPSALATPVVPEGMGTLAYGYMEELAAEARAAGTGQELAAAEQIDTWFDSMGYNAGLQSFTYGPTSKPSYSQNVIAFKEATSPPAGKTVPLVIVGAHYDCVPAGEGADDNASGVGVMLEVAERLAEADLPYDVVFIAFGAEEVGLEGSSYYVKQMSKTDRERAIAMINFDSLIVGDYRYIHAAFNHKTWVRDEMLGIIDDYDLGIRTHTSPRYPAGITPPGFSDYTAFSKAGIAVAAFESTNWEIGDLDGYLQLDAATEFEGTDYDDLWEIWHTEYDYLEFIEWLLGDRPEEHLEAYSTLVYVFLRDLEP